jgi:LmbE family N-acetylglucosaminyl deacetylase
LTLAGVFAHPDDESWSLAGVFALLVPKGVRGVVWTATRGQAGQIAEDAGAAVHGFLERELPDVVVTMEPGGVTAHPDHMATSAAVQAAFAAYAAAGRDREPRLYHWGVPVSKLRRFRELGLEAGLDLPGEDDPYGPRGTPDERFTCWMDTSPVAETAWRALQAHRTQSGDVFYRLLRHRDAWREVFAGVAFVRVHPAPRPGEPPETSLVDAFAGGDGG